MRLITLLGVAVLHSAVVAQVPADETGLGFRIFENGLSYRCVHVPKSRGVCYVLAIRVGADHDPKGQTGLAEAVAELLRSTQAELPEAERFAVSVRGGITLVSAVLDRGKALAGLDRFAALLGGMKEMVSEDVAAKAIGKAALYADDLANIYPGPILYLMAKQDLLRGTPAGRQSVGISKEMIALKSAAVIDRLQRFFRPRNAVFVAMGGMAEKEWHQALESKLGSLPAGPDPTPAAVVVTGDGDPVRKREHARVNAAFVSAALPAPASDDNDYLSFLVAMTALQTRAVSAFWQPRGREAAARFPPFFYNFIAGSQVVLVNRRGPDGAPAATTQTELEEFFGRLRMRGVTQMEIARAAAATAMRVKMPPYESRALQGMARKEALFPPALTLVMGRLLGWSADLPDRIGALAVIDVRRVLAEAIAPDRLRFYHLVPDSDKSSTTDK